MGALVALAEDEVGQRTLDGIPVREEGVVSGGGGGGTKDGEGSADLGDPERIWSWFGDGGATVMVMEVKFDDDGDSHEEPKLLAVDMLIGCNYFTLPNCLQLICLLVPCSDSICASEVQGAATECSQANQCSYTFQYGDGSGTTGYYVSDAVYFDMILGQSSLANSSATVVFGCSNYLSGELTKSDKAVDGIIGFGPGPLSVVSQLSLRGITPKVFSHCLKGDGNGGGILVLGHILDLNIVYTPLLPSQPHYNVNLQGISINGQPLSKQANDIQVRNLVDT
ncbi:aspartic proteinase-like protein 2 [Arachis ipaensis]|uniref:aspartic proteinase-like protein 2 n=1 Tax=Arachis ipaensis TaxID=130454 RepID=UPI000A2B0218|nr:aspartic proteinase-like protein 2 [Arachis ipaensis]